MNGSLFDLTGKTALVTGSSRGIGRALARGLLRAGATVVLNGRGGTRLAEAADELTVETGGRVLTAAFDVTSSADVDAGVRDVLDRVGDLDVLVNNTGMQQRAPVTEFSDADWHRMLETNLTSAFLVSRALAPHLTARGSGKIINVCSVQSELARPGIAPYSATKGGLKMLTRGLAADLGPAGVQVNALAPGYIDTELTSALVADEDFTRWLSGRTPAGRWGRTEDLEGAVVFLAAPASDFVSGQVLYVDGGMTAVV